MQLNCMRLNVLTPCIIKTWTKTGHLFKSWNFPLPSTALKFLPILQYAVDKHYTFLYKHKRKISPAIQAVLFTNCSNFHNLFTGHQRNICIKLIWIWTWRKPEINIYLTRMRFWAWSTTKPSIKVHTRQHKFNSFVCVDLI